MPERLKRKIGPFAVWQWALIVSGIVGLYIYQQRKAQAAAGAAGYNPADYGQIDPNTGVPYALEGTGSGAFGPIDPNTGVPYAFENQQGTPPRSILDQIADLDKLLAALRKAGLLPGKRHKKPKHRDHFPPRSVGEARRELFKLRRRLTTARTRRQRQVLRKQIHQLQGWIKHHRHGHHRATSTGSAAHTATQHTPAPAPRTRIKQGAPSHYTTKDRPATTPPHLHPHHAGGDLQMQRPARRRSRPLRGR